MKKLLKKEVITVLLLLLILLIYFVFNKITNIGIPCIIHELTGFYCPGCGVTRMFFSIIKLEFYQAFRYNPFVFILFCLYILFRIISIFYYLKYKKVLAIPEKVLYIIIALLIVFGILRNIPYFDYLKPTVV